MTVVRISVGLGWTEVFVSHVGRHGAVARGNNRDTKHKFN